MTGRSAEHWAAVEKGTQLPPRPMKLDDEVQLGWLPPAGPFVTWYRPVSLDEMLDLKTQFPTAKVVVGNTEVRSGAHSTLSIVSSAVPCICVTTQIRQSVGLPAFTPPSWT